MKIASETATQLTAVDKSSTSLIAGPILAVIGLIFAAAGFSSRTIALGFVGLVVVLVGVAVVVLRKTRTLTIDKGAGTLSFATKGITGGKTYPANLADVTKLQLVSEYNTTYSNSGGGRGVGVSMGGGTSSTRQSTHLIIALRDGTNLDIAEGSRSMGAMAMVSRVPNQEVGEHIAAFIGVPLETVGPAAPNLGSVVGAIGGMLHHNDTAPSVAAEPPQPPPQPATPPTPAAPDAPGFAMPHDPTNRPAQPAPLPPAAPTAPPPDVPPPPPSNEQPPV